MHLTVELSLSAERPEILDHCNLRSFFLQIESLFFEISSLSVQNRNVYCEI